MDYSQIRKYTKSILAAQNIDPNNIEAKYWLYYDETNNIKKFRINENGNTNVPSDTIFVLGGLEGCGGILLEELKKIFKLQNNISEVKSHHIYHGSFADCLKSTKLETFLDLLINKGWHIHFQSLNLFYWSIVDILDSINGFSSQGSKIYDLKAVLYRIAKRRQDEMILLMFKYSYPDIKNTESLKEFFHELTTLVMSTSIEEYSSFINNSYFNSLKMELLKWLYLGINQTEAVFIQHEQELELLKELSECYRYEIYTWKNSELIMDNESDIISSIEKFDIELDGERVNNYKFVESTDNTMVQLSDIAVGIISKYLKFIDQEGYNLPTVVRTKFDERQMRIFIKLNRLLRQSRDFNPVFFHQTTSIEYNGLLNRYIDEFYQ